MLIHLTPRFYLQYDNVQTDLIDVSIPELNLVLKNGVDLMVKTPYPNKCYKVACRKKGRKAINGLFIETDKPIDDITVITRWSVTGIGGYDATDTVSHTIHFHVNDADFDAVTECQFLWNGFNNTPYRKRSSIQENWITANDQPCMYPMLDDRNRNRGERLNQVFSEINENRLITKRVEYYVVPTVERERLTVPFFGNDRLPAPADAFMATVADNYPYTLKPSPQASYGVYATSLFEFLDDECSELIESSPIHEIGRELVANADADSYFFSNTNDLLNKARMHSKTYNKLEASERESVDSFLSQHFFAVVMGDSNNAKKTKN
ncbi:hypothetical protein F164LOC_18310 [Pectobacterium carotovorum]|nr:hypothetical protein F164LOC_18310 [Pectobacterium carotovorum]